MISKKNSCRVTSSEKHECQKKIAFKWQLKGDWKLELILTLKIKLSKNKLLKG